MRTMNAARRSWRVRALVGLLLAGGCVLGDDTDDSGATSSEPVADGTAGVATGAGSCFEGNQCDPLASACPGDDKCVAEQDAFVCASVPPGTVEAGAGEPCDGSLSCAEGLVCAPVGLPDCVGAPGCCVEVCDLGTPQCPAGTSCSPFSSSDSAICYEDVGICAVMI